MVRRNVYKLPDGMTYQEAAVSEPLGTAIHCIRRSGILPGDTAVVLGSGPLGLMIARLAYLKGARVILSGEITEERKRVASKFGVSEFIDILEITDAKARVEMVKKLTDGERGWMWLSKQPVSHPHGRKPSRWCARPDGRFPRRVQGWHHDYG